MFAIGRERQIPKLKKKNEKYDEEAAVKSQISLNEKSTFYVRWGDMIGRLSLFLSVILLLQTLAKRWMAKKN